MKDLLSLSTECSLLWRANPFISFPGRPIFLIVPFYIVPRFRWRVVWCCHECDWACELIAESVSCMLISTEACWCYGMHDSLSRGDKGNLFVLIMDDSTYRVPVWVLFHRLKGLSVLLWYCVKALWTKFSSLNGLSEETHLVNCSVSILFSFCIYLWKLYKAESTWLNTLVIFDSAHL